ncbi:MAG: hypothetical protein Q8P81_02265 [Nanoarchaeota archaeon]|nr:hypothetical protein [Nanoarchaeota archaeon]
MEKRSKQRGERFYPGDLIYYYYLREDKTEEYFGVIIHRYCDTTKLKTFLEKNKKVIYNEDSEELKQFHVNEIMTLGIDKLITLDDRYLLLVSSVKPANA